MSLRQEVGTILRSVIAVPFGKGGPSKSLSEAIKSLDCATEEIKKDAAFETNTQVLMQMLRRLK